MNLLLLNNQIKRIGYFKTCILLIKVMKELFGENTTCEETNVGKYIHLFLKKNKKLDLSDEQIINAFLDVKFSQFEGNRKDLNHVQEYIEEGRVSKLIIYSIIKTVMIHRYFINEITNEIPRREIDDVSLSDIYFYRDKNWQRAAKKVLKNFILKGVPENEISLYSRLIDIDEKEKYSNLEYNEKILPLIEVHAYIDPQRFFEEVKTNTRLEYKPSDIEQFNNHNIGLFKSDLMMKELEVLYRNKELIKEFI